MDDFSVNDTDICDSPDLIADTSTELFLDLPQDDVFDAIPSEVSEFDSISTDIPQELDSSMLFDANDIRSVNEWISEINPNFDPFDVESPYSTNCGSCAYAVYQRLEGIDDACATEDNIDYNFQMNALTGMEQISMSPEDIQRTLLEAGDGAHAIIGIDRSQGPGHWFNAACIDGKVVAIDGQTGTISDWPPDYGDVVNWEMSMRRN